MLRRCTESGCIRQRGVAYNPLRNKPLADTSSPAPFVALDRVAASGLRGRGGGWFPTWRKWKAVIVEGGEPILIANGAEGEPGSIKDRFAMATRARDVGNGLVGAATAIGAREAILYLKGSFARLATSLTREFARTDTGGVEVTVRAGDDSYVGGEETAVIEWLQSGRAWPRPKPPLPASVGFGGRPTLVQNVETLSYVPRALADPQAFVEEETTLVSLWGHVHHPGIYDVPLGSTLRDVIRDWGGGASDGVSAVFPAGPSAAPLCEADLDVPLDPDALRQKGSALGTAAVLVVGKGACPLSALSSAADFFEREACGQCPPCTLGSKNMASLVRRIEAGQVRSSEIGNLHEIAGFMKSHGYCAHGRTDAAMVTGGLAHFETLVGRHLQAGRCPVSDTAFRPFDAGSPEVRVIEKALEAYLPSA